MSTENKRGYERVFAGETGASSLPDNSDTSDSGVDAPHNEDGEGGQEPAEPGQTGDTQQSEESSQQDGESESQENEESENSQGTEGESGESDSTSYKLPYDEFFDEEPAGGGQREGDQQTEGTPAEQQQEPEQVELDDETREFLRFKDDPFVQKMIEYRKAGENDISKFAEELGHVDYDSLTPEQAYMRDLKQNGVSGDELKEAMQEFDQKKSYQKTIEGNHAKNRLKEAQQNNLQEFSEKYGAKAYQNEQQRKKQQQQQEKIYKKAEADVEQEVEKIKSSGTYLGMEVDTTKAEQIKNDVINFQIPMRGDGTVDVKQLISMVAHNRYGRDIVRANAEAAAKQARKEVIESHQPNPRQGGVGGTGNNPAAGMSEKQKTDSAFMSSYKKKRLRN